jgi:DNA-binding SARP family transcriptional activator
MLRVLLLGEFSIKSDTKAIKAINAPRLQSLIAYLILHSDIPLNRSHLAYLFWPETNESQARTNLRNLLHQLRSVLPNADSYIKSGNQTIQWQHDSEFTLDVWDFKLSISQAEEASHNFDLISVRKWLERGIALYKGDLLPGLYDDWIIPYREELHQLYISTLERLIKLLEEKLDYVSAIEYARRLLQYDPLRETSYQHLIRLYALNNDRASALRIYHACETILKRELDVKPSLGTYKAYENLLNEEARSNSKLSPMTYFPMVGREKEWAQILNAWCGMNNNPGPHIIILCGEAGIGKTRLIEEMNQWAARQGFSTANAQCYSAEGKLAYTPVITLLRTLSGFPLEDIWLTEIARLLPEILTEKPDLAKPGSMTEEWQRVRLFEAISRAFLYLKQPFLLTIDDLQWCDQDTLDWLHFLLHFDQNARFLIVAAYRPEEVENGHPLVPFLRVLRTEDWFTEIDLNPLDEGAAKKLVSMITGMAINQRTAEYLYRETEGNPLFLVEILQANPEINSSIAQDNSSSNSDDHSMLEKRNLPLKIRSILKARLAQLSPEAMELANLAATIGREFSFSLLSEASGLSEDTLINGLDELWLRRIIRERGFDAYDFSHDKLREVAYENLSPARRRLLHRQVARALEIIHSSNLAQISHLVAAHYKQGGEVEHAVPYYLRAAENARKVYANSEAKGYLQRGLKIIESIEEINGGMDSLQESLWEGLGDLLILSAEHEDALGAFTNAQKWVLPSSRVDQARIYRKIAETYRDQREYLKTLEACEQAEILLGKNPHGDFNQWWDEWIDVQIEKVWAYYWLAKWQDLEELVDRINLVVKARASAPSRMRFLKASCLSKLRKYRYFVTNEMLENSKENLATSRQYGSLGDQMECLFELGFLHLWRHEHEQAEVNLSNALELAEKTGNLFFHTLCLTYLTVLYRFKHQEEKVLIFALRTNEAAEIAHMPDYAAAAGANLAWLAFREGDFIEAEKQSQKALDIWRGSPLVYPFQWMALWPKVGVALAENRLEKLNELFEKLSAPTQQILPKELNEVVSKVVQDQNTTSNQDRLALQMRAVELANSTGYL